MFRTVPRVSRVVFASQFSENQLSRKARHPVVRYGTLYLYLLRFRAPSLRVGGLLAAALLHRAGLGVGDGEDDGLVVRLSDAGDGTVVDLILGRVVQGEEAGDGGDDGRNLDVDGRGLLFRDLAEFHRVRLVGAAGLDGDLLGGFIHQHADMRGVFQFGGGRLVETDHGIGDGHDGLACGSGERDFLETLK